jgi:hypothetical protein
MKRLYFLTAALLLAGGVQFRNRPPENGSPDGNQPEGGDEEKDPRLFDEAGNQKTFAPDPDDLEIERAPEINNDIEEEDS